ncbi:LPXTG cell wall anchor domain-containing protein [Limosilactobacillus fermentum]
MPQTGNDNSPASLVGSLMLCGLVLTGVLKNRKKN